MKDFLHFKKLNPDAVLPTRSYPGDAAVDLTVVAIVYDSESDTLIYHTGLAVEIPTGFVGLLFMRSSAVKLGAVLKNAVGVIDSSYRGEITLRYMHVTGKLKTPIRGDKVGQLVLVRFLELEPKFVSELSETERGIKGFGSTGKVN